MEGAGQRSAGIALQEFHEITQRWNSLTGQNNQSVCRVIVVVRQQFADCDQVVFYKGKAGHPLKQ
jgi:hypothetical protein